MTPKMKPHEKANDLVSRNLAIITFGIKQNIEADIIPVAIQLAYKTVEDILETKVFIDRKYWVEVKNEIEKL